jgi:hypothetical protein
MRIIEVRKRKRRLELKKNTVRAAAVKVKRLIHKPRVY